MIKEKFISPKIIYRPDDAENKKEENKELDKPTEREKGKDNREEIDDFIKKLDDEETKKKLLEEYLKKTEKEKENYLKEVKEKYPIRDSEEESSIEEIELRAREEIKKKTKEKELTKSEKPIEKEKQEETRELEEKTEEELELNLREEIRKSKLEKTEKAKDREKNPEKNKEQILNKARKEFALIDLDAEKYTKAQKKLKNKKGKEDFEGYQEKKEIYLKAIKDRRSEMYDKVIKEVEKINLPEKKLEEEIRVRMEDIVREIVINEANKLYDQKIELKLEARKEPSKVEEIKNFFGKAIEKYRKMPLRKKILLTAGLFGGGLIGGAVGGATGAVLITGLATGRWFQRSFGGAATAVGLESLIKRSQEKKTGKETLSQLSDKLAENIKNNDKKLDEKLFELEGKKKREKYQRYILSGTAGVLIGSGAFAEAIKIIIPDNWTNLIKGKVDVASVENLESKVVSAGEVIKETEFSESFIETAGKGDSIWKMSEDQLEKHYGEKFTNLDKAKKTYIIDAIKDKIAENPKKFGLEDIDKIKIGQKFDFSSVLENKSDIEKIFDSAESLKQSSIDNIKMNNKILEDWTSNHPGEELTSEKVDEILTKQENIHSPVEEKTAIKSEIKQTESKRDLKSFQEIIKEADELESKTDFEKEITERVNNYFDRYGLSEGEREVIGKLKINEFMNKFAQRNDIWEAWRNDKIDELKIPSDGSLSAFELNRYLNLRDGVNAFFEQNRDTVLQKKLNVKQFLEMISKNDLSISKK